ncbi:MAG: NUDIX hydrolase [Abitibacteriaceae bacterium]|nr:NUDIX hydrolase [Abditibacteriaceae bacterium]MBV9867080.1 NUDIX hydrolase [Abditibacteriaceae bacterium]
MNEVPATEVAYGGIVFDAAKRVLLRKPANGWGGYAWTFAKGAPDLALDATPEQTALREVREETGVTCEVVSAIPGRYESDTCFTQYFLMRPVNQVPNFDFETAEVRWVTIEEAIALITLTTTPKGRKRDLDALAAAIQASL